MCLITLQNLAISHANQALMKFLDEQCGVFTNRSQFLKTAGWAYAAKLHRAQQNQRDLEIINRRAEYLKAEVMDALSYQVGLFCDHQLH